MFNNDEFGSPLGKILFVDTKSSTERNGAYSSDITLAKTKKFDVHNLNGASNPDSSIPYKGINNTPGRSKQWKLYVGGVQVNENNAHDILDDGGSAVFDATNKQLILTNLNATSLQGAGIANSEIDNLTIVLKGNNSIATSFPQGPGLALSHPTKIIGKGTLTIKSGERSAGIYINKSILTIDNCQVSVVGNLGICGYDGSSNEMLILNNAKFNVDVSKGVLFQMNKFILNDCHITEPDGVIFLDEEHALFDNSGKLLLRHLVIENDKAFNSNQTLEKSCDVKVVAIYSILGEPLESFQKGINIVRYSNGQVKKLIW